MKQFRKESKAYVKNIEKIYKNELKEYMREFDNIHKQYLSNCTVCHERRGYHSDMFDIRLCDVCKNMDTYTCMYLTTALKKYYLCKDDLNIIDMLDYEKKMHGKIMTVHVVKETDVKDVFMKKYNINNAQIQSKLDELANHKTIQSEIRQKNKMTASNKRRAELINALHEKKLKLRNDSKLCEGFINGRIKDQDVSDVVDRMCQMEFLHNYTDFASIFEKCKRDELDYNGHYDYQEIFESAEHRAIKKIGGYPEVYPWLLA